MNYSECSLDQLLRMRSSLESAIVDKKTELKEKELSRLVEIKIKLQNMMREENFTLDVVRHHVVINNARQECSPDIQLFDGMKW